MSIRGIDHVGVTVPDLERATQFFVEGLDAVYMYDIVDAPLGGEWIEQGLCVPEGTVIRAIRVLRLANGPNLELFDYATVQQQPAARPSDFDYQHLALFVEDIDAVTERLARAGATVLGGGPHDLPGAEAGPGCRFVYTRTPWGSTLELVHYGTDQAYHRLTEARKWTPQPVRE